MGKKGYPENVSPRIHGKRNSPYILYFGGVKERLDSITLLIILLVGGILKFWDYTAIPFSHDEYSVLFRTGFDNWNDLIKKGVMVDTHPAGIQVFVHWWTQWLGNTEWIMKLPFTLFGMGAIYLTYRIGKEWFNSSVGLLAAAFMASLQYPIFYSQLARPYISGLFFCLLTAFFWSKVIQSEGKSFTINTVLFVLSASLCTYNHHFSALTAAVIGISGLFIVPKEKMRWYLLSGLAIFILYIPHLPIFLHQLGKGGVGAWLGKPDSGFFIEYILYLFQFSIGVLIAVVLFVLVFGRKRLQQPQLKFYRISLIWFLVPLLIGFFYSVFSSPVLQYSVLIFSFPFLLFAILGRVRLQSPKFNLAVVLIILGVNSYALIFQRDHYYLMYESVYENIIDDSNEALDEDGEMVTIYNSHEKITHHLVSNDGFRLNPEYLWYNDSAQNIIDLKEYIGIKGKDSKRLFLGTLTRSEPLLIPIILDYYPKVVEQRNYFGGTTMVFDKKEGKDPSKYSSALSIGNKNELNQESWSSVDANLIEYDDSLGLAFYSFKGQEWGPAYQSNVGAISSTNDLIDIKIAARSSEPLSQALIVSEIQKGGENIHWSATPFSSFYMPESFAGEIQFFHHTLKLADIPRDHDDLTIKTFIWNKGKESFEMLQFEVRVLEGNPVIYGLYEDINP